MSGYEKNLQSNLGLGMPGVSKLLVGPADNTCVRGNVRHYLRNSFRTDSWTRLAGAVSSNDLDSAKNARPICGSFRASLNAGDPLGRKDRAGGGSNQVNGIKGATLNNALKERAGSIQPASASGKGSGMFRNLSSVNDVTVPVFSGNPKFVYDGSDYIKFKKNSAINKTYNDSSSGGDQNNASYVALKRSKR